MATNSTVKPISKEQEGHYPTAGMLSWIMTVDHKRIGLLYMGSSFVYFLIGGVFALLLRIQLAQPNARFLSNDAYNQIFTMHGTTMIFLVVMPLSFGLANYVVPLMIGARDMAFPKLNALSYWLFLFGGLFMFSSFIFGGAPNDGWFAYAPLTDLTYSPGHGMDFWALSILLLTISTTLTSINFIVTVIQMRAPGMTFGRMPLFVWMTSVTSFLAVFALPSLTTATVLLILDRNVGTHFFDVQRGGNALLWQHLFWFFGHPEVYILILPTFGVMSEIVPVFSRQPLFGYKAVAFSGIAIGILGFMVWAHHMFTTGLPNAALMFFAADSFLIGVPTGVKIFAWLATMWGGKLRFDTPMLFAIGTISLFTIGGLDGIHVAVVPVDWQVTDSYYVVSHLHYVLFGGAVFGLTAAAYYWFPKFSGRRLNETLGKWHFWLMFISANMVFFPMHMLGLQGMPRRIYTYDTATGWGFWNLFETIGAFILAFSFLLFMINLFITLARPADNNPDPWDAYTLEWKTSSPPPAYNFAEVQPVLSARPLWDEKYPDKADWKLEEE
jgi:cytochrome c oxidase subunit I